MPLSHAVAHCRHPTRDLRGRAHLPRENLDLRGIAFVGLARRQHVVERGDDRWIRPARRANVVLCLARRSEPMRKVTARQARTGHSAIRLLRLHVKVATTRRFRSLDDSIQALVSGILAIVLLGAVIEIQPVLGRNGGPTPQRQDTKIRIANVRNGSKTETSKARR